MKKRFEGGGELGGTPLRPPEARNGNNICDPHYHTGPSFNTGTENTIQVSKCKGIGFEKRMADFDGGE